MKNKLIQVAIDGPSGAGKTTVGQLVATKLNIIYLSTGKIFRSYAYALRSINCSNSLEVRLELKQFKLEFNDGRFLINGLDVTRDINNDAYSMNASIISAYPFVRKRYEKDLKKIVKKNSLVIDGRDIGTVILPHTPYKFFLDASLEVRAKRRAKELHKDIKGPDFKKLMEQMKKRDHQDTHRRMSPLRKAKDAFVINSDNMTAEQVADLICEKVNKSRQLWVWKKLH